MAESIQTKTEADEERTTGADLLAIQLMCQVHIEGLDGVPAHDQLPTNIAELESLSHRVGIDRAKEVVEGIRSGKYTFAWGLDIQQLRKERVDPSDIAVAWETDAPTNSNGGWVAHYMDVVQPDGWRRPNHGSVGHFSRKGIERIFSTYPNNKQVTIESLPIYLRLKRSDVNLTIWIIMFCCLGAMIYSMITKRNRLFVWNTRAFVVSRYAGVVTLLFGTGIAFGAGVKVSRGFCIELLAFCLVSLLALCCIYWICEN
jgi:hypothetical protein